MIKKDISFFLMKGARVQFPFSLKYIKTENIYKLYKYRVRVYR